jgi:hypothetical protein
LETPWSVARLQFFVLARGHSSSENVRLAGVLASGSDLPPTPRAQTPARNAKSEVGIMMRWIYMYLLFIDHQERGLVPTTICTTFSLSS